VKIQNVKVGVLKPAEYNPRKWSKKTLKDIQNSLENFGMVTPIIVNSAPKRKNIVIGGHLRLKVAKDFGYKEVPVVYVSIADIEKEKELNIRLNKNVGEWDYDMLKNWSEIDLIEFGFIGSELNEIFNKTVELGGGKKESIEKMELQFNEKYDYIVLLFKNKMDWLNALQKFGIKKVNYSVVKTAKIGLGRVIDGKRALQKI